MSFRHGSRARASTTGLFLLLFTSAACAGAPAAPTPTAPAPTVGPTAVPTADATLPPQELTRVRLAYNPGTGVRLYAALEENLFEKHGIDLELVRFESGAAANAAFASGDVDIGFTGIPGFFASRLAGAGTRVFLVDHDGWEAEGLVVRPDSGISSVQDLPGKTIGTVIGTTSWVALVSALEAEGIDPADVDIQNVPPAAWVPAFDNADVDGIWGWAPLLYSMVEAGGILAATTGEYVMDPILYQARGAFIDEEFDAVVGFVAALAEAEPAVEARDPAFLSRMQEETGASESVARATVDAVKPVSVEQSVLEDSPYTLTGDAGLMSILDAWFDVLHRHQIFAERPDYDVALDPSVVEGYLAGR